MCFKLLVTSKAAEVRYELKTSTFLAFSRPIRLVFLMGVLALAASSPCIHIKTLSSDKPPLAHLLGSPRYEPESFTIALLARRIEFLLGHVGIMSAVQVPTEAFRLRTDSKAIISGRITSPSDVDPRHLGLLSMLKFPSQHLPGSD